jgi:diacylglycerol kinase family enzyme
VRESLIGLGRHRSRVDVGILPLGNANVAARELGIPLAARKALAVIVEAEAVRVDLGEVRTEAGSDLFLAMVGVGWDAITVRYIDRLRHTRFGGVLYRVRADLVYVLCGLLAACHVRPTRFRVQLDGRPVSGDFCAAHFCNLATYGKGMRMAPGAGPRTGHLHHQLRKISWLPALVWHLIAAQLQLRVPAFISRYEASKTALLESRTPVPVQVDGDYYGERSVLDVRVLPAAARVLVGRRCP